MKHHTHFLHWRLLRFTFIFMALCVSSLRGATVAEFFSASFVDTLSGVPNAEAWNIRASLEGQGHTVQTFTDISSNGLFIALSGTTVLVIPEQEVGSLSPFLSTGARFVISNYVAMGGKMLVHGWSDPRAGNLLNSVFGFGILENRPTTTYYSKTANLTGSSFNSAPASIGSENGTSALYNFTLPAGAIPVYTDGSFSAVVVFHVGAGSVVFLGWDWFNAQPNGSQNGGWLAVLGSAMTYATPPTITCSSNLLLTSASPTGAVVNFNVTATNYGGSVPVVCTPANGSVFPVGISTVVCSATDAGGEVSTCSFDVTVRALINGNDPIPQSTGDGGNFNPVSNTTLAGGTYNFRNFIIPAGVTVNVTGSNPLRVHALGKVEIYGSLIASGGNGGNNAIGNAHGGAGGSSVGGGGAGGGGGTRISGAAQAGTNGFGPGGGLGATLPSGVTIAGGGGGAGFGGPGANGANGTCCSARCDTAQNNAGAPAGPAYGDYDTLQGGSGGGGGAGSGADNASGAGGGGGGGAIYLEGASILISSSGAIRANGGNGGSSTHPDSDGSAGGGGSGGMIWLRGINVTNRGVIQAIGGSGGTTVIGSSCGFPGAGGNGANGRIRRDGWGLEDTGSISPASAITVLNFTDTTPPVLNCPEYLSTNCQPGGIFYPISATDLVDPAPSIVCTPPPGTVFPVGVSTVNCTATDASGNSSPCSFSVQVDFENNPPVANPGGPYYVLCGNGMVTFAGFGSYDPDAECGDSIQSYYWTVDGLPFLYSGHSPTLTQSDLQLLPGGVPVTVRLTVMDEHAQTAYAETTLTRIDTEPPQIELIGPPTITWYRGSAYSEPGATASDTCSSVSAVTVVGTVDVNTVGTYTLLYSAIDAAGNSNSVTRTVEVVGPSLQVFEPIMELPYRKPVLDGLSTLDFGTTTVAHPVTRSLVLTNSGALPLIITAIHVPPGYTVVNPPTSVSRMEVFSLDLQFDASAVGPSVGNLQIVSDDPVSPEFEVALTGTAEDGTPPVIICPGNMLVKTPNTFGAGVSFNVTANDNSAVASLVCTPASGSFFPLGVTQISCVATDVAGNTNTCSFNVTVVLSSTNQVMVNAPIPDASPVGVASTINVNSPIGAITDVNVTLHVTNGWNGDLYAYLVHGSGFSVLLNRVGRSLADSTGYSHAGFEVTLDDEGGTNDIHLYGAFFSGPLLTGEWSADGRETDPALVLDTDARTAPLSAFHGLNPNGEWTLFIADAEPADTSTLVSWGLELCGTAGVAPSITNQPVTVTVECKGSAVFTAGVQGTAPMWLQWHRNEIALPGQTNATLSLANLSPADSGAFALKASNHFGSVTSAVAYLGVFDASPPVITLNGDTSIQIECHTPYVELGAVAVDNCEGTLAVSISGLVDSDAPGTYVVSYQSFDGSENLSEVLRTVTVVDTTAPTIVAPPDLTVECESAVPLPDFAGGTVADVCDASPSVVHVGDSVSGSNPRTIARTYRVSDAAGNTALATQTIVVHDTTPPSIAAPESVTIPAQSGLCAARAVTLSAPVVSDNCAVATVVNDAPDVFPIGTIAVTWTVTDINGLTANSQQTVTVTEVDPPIITVQPQGAIVLLGSSFTLTAAATACTNSTYQWCLGTNAIPEATNATLELSAVSLADAGSYTVKVSNSAGSVTSQVAVLVINRPPVAGVDGGGTHQGGTLRIHMFKLLADDTDPDGDSLSLQSVSSSSTQGGTVVFNSPYVVYTPPSGFYGEDVFTYTITDGRGGTATGSVHVFVANGALPGLNQIALIPRADGVLVRFAGMPGYAYALQRAQDVTGPWTPIAPLVAPPHGIMEFLDTDAPPSMGFYRTLKAP